MGQCAAESADTGVKKMAKTDEKIIKGNCYCPNPEPNSDNTKCLYCGGKNPQEPKTKPKTKGRKHGK